MRQHYENLAASFIGIIRACIGRGQSNLAGVYARGAAHFALKSLE